MKNTEVCGCARTHTHAHTFLNQKKGVISLTRLLKLIIQLKSNEERLGERNCLLCATAS
jgi:hypothetical protein